MSLGFLTESALVPSKAKEIKIDAKSLVDLKAVVYRKDQERKRRLQEALTVANDSELYPGHGARLSKYAHLRSGDKRPKRSRRDRVGSEYRNKGVDSRSRRDEEAEAREAPREDDDKAWRKKSAEMLRKKARLYEEMVNGGGDEQLKGEYLVNFDAKQRVAEATSLKRETAVEIKDDFGRTMKPIAMAFMDTLQPQPSSETMECDGEEIEKRLGKSGGSFVVSQWEKRLKSVEKDHVNKVHERAILAQLIAHGPLSDVVAKKTRKQLRLDRLRKQQEDSASSENVASTSPAADFAASEQATDFLSLLM